MPSTATIEMQVPRSVEFTTTSVEQPDGPRAPARVQPRLETVIRVSAGIVYLIAGEDETVLLPGDEAVIPAGMPYRRWNAGDEEARYAEIFRPRPKRFL
jgi:uncharacterized RmlC-like cupin family protein